MALPKAEPGLVFRYDFVWHDQASKARASGKARPACIAVALDDPSEPTTVVILPITHSKPGNEAEAVEIPAIICRRLGLDEERSWIVVSQYNVDNWPNGISLVPGRSHAYAYGYLPPGLFDRVKRKFVEIVTTGRARKVRR